MPQYDPNQQAQVPIWMQQGQAQGGAVESMQQMSKVARERGAALDTSGGLDDAIVRAKITEVAVRIIGDDEEIEADSPLMESGLTSNTAVLLRDELTQEIPGI